MTDTTPHRATAEQWADVESWAAEGLSCYSSILELRSRLEALEASATCPHVVSSDEGTSYCALAEQQAATPPKPAPAGSLVKTVHIAISTAMGHGPSEARAAIRAVAEWLRENEISFHAAYCLDRELKQ